MCSICSLIATITIFKSQITVFLMTNVLDSTQEIKGKCISCIGLLFTRSDHLPVIWHYAVYVVDLIAVVWRDCSVTYKSNAQRLHILRPYPIHAINLRFLFGWTIICLSFLSPVVWSIEKAGELRCQKTSQKPFLPAVLIRRHAGSKRKCIKQNKRTKEKGERGRESRKTGTSFSYWVFVDVVVVVLVFILLSKCRYDPIHVTFLLVSNFFFFRNVIISL